MTHDDLILIFTRGLGPRTIHDLVAEFGSAEAVIGASRRELMERGGLREDIAQCIVRREAQSAAEQEVEYCRKHGIIMLAATDPEYPETLKQCIDRPHVLFVQGNVEALSMDKPLAMVGTREMTPSGATICNRLVTGLGKRLKGLCIVSGLAYGVDAACHRSALANNIPTVAVLASVLPEITPAPHRAIAKDILKSGGAIVSELHSQTRQNGSFFIARNRIIAGLTQGTLVVESPASGGSLATADIADSYHRVVMAVPGRLTDVASFGCNNLIRTGKARLVLTPDDIISDLGWTGDDQSVEDESAEDDLESLTPNERAIYDIIASKEVVLFDEIINRSQLAISDAVMSVTNLELKGLVRSMPGQRYEKI